MPVRILALLAFLLAAGDAAAQTPNLPPSKPGFPLTFAGQGPVEYSQVVVADLGLSTDGTKSIVYATTQGELWVIRKSAGGTWGAAPGFPVTVGTYVASSPAVGDLTGDGVPEIVVGHGDHRERGPGGVKAYRVDGSLLWARDSEDVVNGPDGKPDPVYGTPAIGDVDGDGAPDVAWGGLDFYVHLVDGATGADKSGWPHFVRDTIFSSPALYDVDGDGRLDVVIGVDAHAEGPPFNTPDGGCLHAFRWNVAETPGFPRCIDQVIVSAPSIGDIDGDGEPEIVHGTGIFWPNRSERVYAWHLDGSAVTGWPVTIKGQATFSPALANLDADPALEVVVTADNSRSSSTFRVYAFDGNGTKRFETVPKDFFGVTLGAGEPVVADVLGTDAAPEILVPTNTSVAVLSANGAQISDDGTHAPGVVVFYAATTIPGVTVADLDDDGAKVEVVAVSAAPFPSAVDTVVHVWNPVNRACDALWGAFRRDPDRRGVAPGTPPCNGPCVPVCVLPTPTPTMTVPPTATPSPSPTLTPSPSPSATPRSAAATKCQRTVTRELWRFADARAKALTACELAKVRGKLPLATDCATEPATAAKLGKASTKLAAAVDKACGGADKRCGGDGSGEIGGTGVGWPTSCPEFQDATCAGSVGQTDCQGIASCLDCVAGAHVDRTLAASFDPLVPSDPATAKALNVCQQAIGKATLALVSAHARALQKCWDGRILRKHTNPCPDGDAKTLAALAKAEAKGTALVCKACGGADKLCDQVDDLAPTAIGFPAVCPDVMDPEGMSCAAPVATLLDLARCVACVGHARAHCIDRTHVPDFASYSTACADE